jgi:hypothetical protein
MKTDIEIQFNKGKVLTYAFGAFAFVCAGVFFAYVGLVTKNHFFLRLFLSFLGIVSTSFFGLILLIILPKAIKNKAGLIITDKGLYDYSSAISAGLITWTEIKKISHSYSGANIFLLVKLKNPDKFIARQKWLIKRIAMRLNYKMSDTPVHILLSLLDTDINTLYNIITEKRYQKITNKEQTN